MPSRNLSKLVFALGCSLFLTVSGAVTAQSPAPPLQGRITICHANGNGTYTEITLNANALFPAHSQTGPDGGHPFADLINVAPGSCPSEGGVPAAVPEPVTMLLFGAGLAGIGYAAKRRRRRAA